MSGSRPSAGRPRAPAAAASGSPCQACCRSAGLGWGPPREPTAGVSPGCSPALLLLTGMGPILSARLLPLLADPAAAPAASLLPPAAGLLPSSPSAAAFVPAAVEGLLRPSCCCAAAALLVVVLGCCLLRGLRRVSSVTTGAGRARCVAYTPAQAAMLAGLRYTHKVGALGHCDSG
jgi:hypothetical protein